MYWIVLIGFTAAVLYIMYSRKKRLYDSGQIIKRSPDYLKQAHYFTRLCLWWLVRLRFGLVKICDYEWSVLVSYCVLVG